ncbi:AraC family transcriptional regulator [Acinetobacter guerrae]|uniref:AraC family transcriptional regulator n=1 Tax=Acinetobacter guerrae TaxID=1843371 RepID=UPI00125EF69E|nr:helix-turn-helix transcriptional regulator [Acinetobacter guerrae]
MSSSIFEPDLIIGLSSEHAYKDTTYAHAHFRAQLLYASTGSIQVYTDHQLWILPPRCALWIPPRVEHSVTFLSQVKLNTALIEEQAAYAMGKNCFLIRVSNLLHELLIRFNELDQLKKQQIEISQPVLHALQMVIFNEIQHANSLAIQIPWPKDKRLIGICKALLQAPDQLKDLNTWADEIGTSSRTLMRMFQKETGLSYRAWIQQMHIALALSKIADGYAIYQISESLGYASASAFSAMFKRHLGKTPQQFKTGTI